MRRGCRNHDGEPTTGTPATPVNGGMGLPNGLVPDENGRVVPASAAKQQPQQQ